MPVVEGRSPVSRLARDGLHNGDWQCALAKSVPRLARPSMFGVLACGWPPRQPIQSFWSSMAMNKTFGFSAEPAAGANVNAARSMSKCRRDFIGWCRSWSRVVNRTDFKPADARGQAPLPSRASGW